MSGADRLTVIHCIAPARFGGIESVVRALGRGLIARQHDVRVVAVVEDDPGNHPAVRALREAGVTVVALRIPARGYVREARELSGILRTIGTCIVHTHGFRSDVVAGFVARRLGLPLVSTVHGFTRGGLKNRTYEWLQRRALRHFDAVVAVSRPIERELLAHGVPGARLHMVQNAVDRIDGLYSRAEARRALGLPTDGFRVGWVGRLSQEKGPDVLVEAVGLLKDRQVHAAVIGEGPDLGQLRERCAQLGVADRVAWLGARPDASRYLRGFDALVLSSRTEGTPIVLLEGIAAGVPVVTTAVGGIPSVVGEQEALIVPPENPAALAEAIAWVLDDPAGAARRRDAALAALRLRFGTERWLDAYESIYRAVQREQKRS